MSHPLSFLIDTALREAEANGAFDNLPGAGKPLPPVDNPKNAVVDRIMKEANAKPPAVVYQQKIVACRKRLAALTDEADRRAEQKTLADLQTRLEIEKEAWRRYG